MLIQKLREPIYGSIASGLTAKVKAGSDRRASEFYAQMANSDVMKCPDEAILASMLEELKGEADS